MPTTAANRAGSLAIIGAAVLWGTTGTAASFFPENVSPLAIGAVTMIGGGVLLFLRSFRSSQVALRDSRARRWLLLGALGVVMYPLAFYSSMNLAGIAVGNVVSLGTGPLFAALLERLIDHRHLSRLWAATTSIALLGVILLAFGGSHLGATTSGTLFPGVILGLVAGFAYALYTYCSTRAIRIGHSSDATMGAMFGTGALGLLPVLIAFGAPILHSAGSMSLAVYLIIGPMFVAYVLFGRGLRTTSSSTATTITLLEPVVATLLAVLIVGEVLSPVSWAGLGLIFVAVSVLSTARHPRKTLDSS